MSDSTETFSTTPTPKPRVENSPNYVLGRGRVYVDDRYLGNAPSFYLHARMGGKIGIGFVVDEISRDNVELYFRCLSEQKLPVRYEADNAKGVNLSFDFPVVRLKADRDKPFELISGEWQSLPFVGRVENPWSYSYPVIEIRKIEIGGSPNHKWGFKKEPVPTPAGFKANYAPADDDRWPEDDTADEE